MPYIPSIWDSLSSQEHLIDPEEQDLGEMLSQQQLEQEAEADHQRYYQKAINSNQGCFPEP